MSGHTVIIPCLYYGTIQAYAHIVNAGKVIIEVNDHYSRRTYRNRTTILAAHGPMDLTVPVIKPKGKTRTKDIKISYDTNWQKNHWKSIESAYNNSPFFEYYKDDLEPVYRKQWKYLADLNIRLLELIIEMTETEALTEQSNEYIIPDPQKHTDLREVIHPKKDYRIFDKKFSPAPYRQVFSGSMDFVPNLSILDLIFNKGPETYSYLESIIEN
jgi:hypothetical protein